MIGTGSAFAKVFDNNNALITVDGQTLMVDCGITAPKALYELGHSFNDINAILLTHIHGDHVGGLEEFAFQMKYIFKRKPILYISAKLVEPLWEHTLKGGLQQEEAETLNHFFDVRPLEENVAYELFPGLRVQLILLAIFRRSRTILCCLMISFFIPVILYLMRFCSIP
jgi:glyoxylase-like metal-dependent hydrolase (beta-lactamase superfamily II)